MRPRSFPSQASILAVTTFALLTCVLLPPSVRAQLYRWTDEQGHVHVTNNPNDVPPRYRSQPPPAAPPPPAGAAPSPRASDAEADARRRSVEQWRNALRSPSVHVRGEAAQQGHLFGPQAVPDLTQALTDPSTDVRIAAITSLGAIGPGARSAGPPLARVLRDPDANLRMWAAAALLRIGTHAKEALRVWIAEFESKAVSDPGPGLMVGFFGVAPAAVPALVEARRGRDPRVRKAAVQLLGLVTPPSPEAIAALIQALKDPALEVQKGAAQSLSDTGPAAVSAVPALMEALKSPHVDLRRAVPEAIDSIAPGSPQLMSALLLGLKDTDPEVQKQVASLVGVKGPAARELVPALLEGIRSPDAKVRESMLKALGTVSRTQPNAEAIAAAIQALKDPVLEVQDAAATSLSWMGRSAAPAVPALIDAFNNIDGTLRQRVLMTLVAIAPDSRQVMSTVVLGLRDSDAQVQWRAASLAHLLQGPGVRDLVPALLAGARSPDARVRSATLGALGRMAMPASREVAQGLTEGLRDPELSVRQSSANSLATAGPEAVVALPLLIQALADPDWAMRGAAVKALGSIGPPGKDALRSLKELERREPGRQREIAESIWKIEGR
jgi:HEAT repeat protein